MKLVLMTGAGASTLLGNDKPLPLMPDLSRELFKQLNGQVPGLAGAMHLRTDMSGPEFEEALGLLFRWREEARPLNERFAGLGVNAPDPGSVRAEVREQWRLEAERLQIISRVVDQTLFREFGSPAIDKEAAGEAYGRLFRALGDIHSGGSLVCATTNYDASLEIAIHQLGGSVDLGFRGGPDFETPVLSPADIDPWNHKQVPVLHLHGAVGWYRRDDGTIMRQPPDQPPNLTLGRPALLYPDPDKNPAEEVTRELWDVFRTDAMSAATHVLVLGHSLHDEPLRRTVKVIGATTGARVGVMVLSERMGEPTYLEILDTGLADMVSQELPDATVIRAAFGPDAIFAMDDIAKWLGKQGQQKAS